MSLFKFLPPIIKQQVKKAKEKNMVIPFVKPEAKLGLREDKITLKLRSQPDDKDSSTYELRTYLFRDGTPEEWLEHKKVIKKCLIGQNIKTGPPQFAMLRRLLGGKTLNDLEAVIVKKGYDETTENLQKVLEDLTKELFPTKALQKQKRGLRRHLVKPMNMRTSTFYARLVELNEQLLQFPGADAESKLPEDELKEILEFALPSVWRMQMTLARFDPQEKTIREFLDHCKELEGLEMEFVTLAPVGVDDRRPMKEDRKSRLKKDRIRKSRESDQEDHTDRKRRRTEDFESRDKDRYTRKYQDYRKSSQDYRKSSYKKQTRFDTRKTVPDVDKKTFSQEEMNVIILHERSKAVALALKAKNQVDAKYPRKVRPVQETQDLESQVEKLKLYRDDHVESDGERSRDDDSSCSSQGSSSSNSS